MVWWQLRPDSTESVAKDDGCHSCKWNWADVRQCAKQLVFPQEAQEAVCLVSHLPALKED